MARLAEIIICVAGLIWLPAAIVVAKEDNDDKPLFFRPLDYFAACADGSPAGVYTDFFGSSSEETRSSHIIHFQGGGGCSSESTCQILFKQKPYSFSSMYEFESITGHTIVSNDPFENPGLADDFAKWVVPYCSQDLWLGSGKEVNGFLRGGSLQVDATLRHWFDAVTASNNTDGAVETLVLSGHSAGTFAILNHMDLIRSIASEAGVKRLRFVLDASMLSDSLMINFESSFAAVVDPEVHPLCLEDPEKIPYSELQNPEELSQLPCCLSTHCMLRHSPSMNDIKSEPSSKDERLLLIDTAYDFLQAVSNLESIEGNPKENYMMGITSLSNTIFSVGESAGKRKARILETLFAGGRYVGPNVVWAMPSAILHNTLLPSVELSSRLCDREVAEEDTLCESEESDCLFLANPFGFQDVCNATGTGLRAEFFGGLKVTSWTNTEAWKRASINGKSVRDIISTFVLSPGPTDSSQSNQPKHATFLFDTCPGPNCVPEGQKSSNPVQMLLEIEDNSVGVSALLMALVSTVLFAIVVGYLFMAHCEKTTQQKPKRLTSRSLKSEVYIKGLCVESDKGSKILEDVDLSLEHSTVNCLLGKSGSGKSTLLSVLCCQLKPNLNVSLKAASDLSSVPSTFMRQLDLVTMENVTPINYLQSTSKIYGADSETLAFVLGLIKPFFLVKTRRDENDTEIILLDPFHNAAIKDLSGGQRRMLAIAAALFQNSSLLLLDEPVSGLDSVSSMKVIEFLRFIAQEHDVTILMTLHQPSGEILDAMDETMVLSKGKVVFDSRVNSIGDKRQSTPDFIHELLSGETEVKKIICDVDHETSEHNPSPFFMTERNRRESSNHFCGMKEPPHIPENDELLEPYLAKLRLWQVRPLVRRMSLEYCLKAQDVLVLPMCFLLLALGGIIDAKNPYLLYTLNAMLLGTSTVIFQVRVVLTWDMLVAHRWDLEDKRIAPVAYLVASGFKMIYMPIIAIPISLAIPYATLGWKWDAFWPSSLFYTLTTIVMLQIGKTISTKVNYWRQASAAFNLLVFLSLVMAGIFVSPSKFPAGIQLILFLSPFFWGNAGVLLTVFHERGEEQPCQSFAACIANNPSVRAHATGFAGVTTARTAMYVLIGMVLILVLIEYHLLCKKVVQRNDYTLLTESKKDHDRTEEEEKPNTEGKQSDSSSTGENESNISSTSSKYPATFVA